MKTSKILLFSIVIVGLATSCEKAYVMPKPLEKDDVIDITQPFDTVYYSTIQAIWDGSSCTDCHDGSQSPDLTAGNSYNALNNATYINAANPTLSLLYTKINVGGTMNGYLNDQANIDVVKKWIQQGAKNY